VGRGRVVVLLLSVVGAVVAIYTRGRIPQAAAYHGLADQRDWLGIPNAADVLSNVPFLVSGILGLALLRRGRARFHDHRERAAWAVFFSAVFLVGFGSAWYHLHPDNSHLVWDRFPIAVAAVSLLAAVIGERVSPAAGRALLGPLVALALGSVAWWGFTQSRGQGDLRLYGLVQFYPVLGTLLVIALWPARYTHGASYVAVVLWYAAAKFMENWDRWVYDATGCVASGHTLKHLFAAAATFQVVWMLARRTPLARPLDDRPAGWTGDVPGALPSGPP